MSLQFRIADQVLTVDDKREATEAIVHKHDAFLNLLCTERYAFQRDAVRETLRFLVSDKYPNLERLARENWTAREPIRQRFESVDLYLERMPLKDRKAVSLDLATGTGKSYVMYALAAVALAEGLADRVLVLCPSLTIEEGLLEKFTALAGNGELSAIMKELGAAVAIPAIKRGN
jgi:type III restriction enzyme